MKLQLHPLLPCPENEYFHFNHFVYWRDFKCSRECVAGHFDLYISVLGGH